MHASAGRVLTLATLLLAVAPPLWADTLAWQSTASGELTFGAFYEGEEIPGRFGRFTARVESDAADGSPSALTVVVDTASADMNDTEVNAALTEPDWFAVDAYPQATYESRDISCDGGHCLAHGTLNIKGIARALDLPFDWRRLGSTAGLAGTVTVSRHAWRVGSGEWAEDDRVADRVLVRFDVQLVPAQ